MDDLRRGLERLERECEAHLQAYRMLAVEAFCLDVRERPVGRAIRHLVFLRPLLAFSVPASVPSERIILGKIWLTWADPERAAPDDLVLRDGRSLVTARANVLAVWTRLEVELSARAARVQASPEWRSNYCRWRQAVSVCGLPYFGRFADPADDASGALIPAGLRVCAWPVGEDGGLPRLRIPGATRARQVRD